MSSLKLQSFSGLIPRLSARLLPDAAATVARNVDLLNGELRGFRGLFEIADFTSDPFTVRRVHRVPYEQYGSSLDAWLRFDDRNVDVVRSPVVNDSFFRYYWAGDGRPMYSTRNRIIQGLTPHYLGIPTPVNAPTVTPPGGTDVTRAYVYTFVSDYGEEGAPSPPTLATGNAGTWVLSNMDSTVPDAANRNVRKKRVYRTVPGNASSTFFFVAEILSTDTGYVDTQTDTVVAANNVLESASWAEPPTTMEGFALTPNGYLVGWAGRRLLFSEPYHPHAWPAEYELATDYDIVGVSIWNNLVIIATEASPYIGQGVTPAAFTMQKIQVIEPCLSRRGIVSMMPGVYYPSPNGLVQVNSGGVVNVTQSLLTKKEWSIYDPANIFATQLGMQYVAFNSNDFGFIFNPVEPTAKLVELDAFEFVEGIETDPYSGSVYIISDDRVWEWDPLLTDRIFYRWKSKEFHFQKPLNFGAAILKSDSVAVAVDTDIFEAYNTARFAAGPLSVLNGSAILAGTQDGGSVPTWLEPENRQPLGGSPLFQITFLQQSEPSVRLLVYANGELRFDRVITTQNMFRLPSGFKADVWQFEIIGNTTVYSLQVAETGKELEAV